MILIILLFGLLLIFNAIIYLSLSAVFRKKELEAASTKFSIVVSVKNESKNIPNLINSLNGMDYPFELIERIIIDDNSEDDTYNTVIKNLEEQNYTSKSLVLKAEDKILPAKKGALTIGIEKASYSNIIITDGDCTPNKNWLKAFSAKFNQGYDVLFGIAPFYQENSFTNRISCFENLRSSILTFALAEAGHPYSAAARSFAFTKKAYNLINGYKNTMETLSGDDDLFIRETVKYGLKTGTVTNTFVYSSTKKNLRDYFNQKGRHTSTSNYYLPKHKILLASWHLLNIICIFSPFLIVLDFSFIILFTIKVIADFIQTSRFQEFFGYHFSLLQRIYLQIVYELFLIIHYIRGTFGKIKW